MPSLLYKHVVELLLEPICLSALFCVTRTHVARVRCVYVVQCMIVMAIVLRFDIRHFP